MNPLEPKYWMKVVLWLAAIYNIAWGALAITFPNAAFQWAGMPLPNYPELWQCIGMIVGVYGVGYAVAASDPYRHWPVVLVGLLGKTFGPIGFAQAFYSGRFPLGFGWNVVGNDLIWWMPFALILLAAHQAHIHSRRVDSPEVIRMALRTRTPVGASIEELSQLGPVLLVFLRHTGCMFCREAMGDLAAKRAEIEAAGTQLVLVHMSPESQAHRFLGRYNLSDVVRIADPRRSLYRAFGLRRGSLMDVFGPKVWLRVFEAGVLKRHGGGLVVGDGFQMPGVFLIYQGEVLRSYRHHSIADRPDYVSMSTDGGFPQLSMG